MSNSVPFRHWRFVPSSTFLCLQPGHLSPQKCVISYQSGGSGFSLSTHEHICVMRGFLLSGPRTPFSADAYLPTLTDLIPGLTQWVKDLVLIQAVA